MSLFCEAENAITLAISACLLYTSDAADDSLRVDLGGRRIIKKVRRLEIRTRRLVTDSVTGAYHSSFKGRGMDFEEVREYAIGDDVRTIDWNVSAKMDRPFVKVFREERELTLMLLIDLSASGIFGSVEQSKRERAAEIASVIAFSASQNNDKVGLLLYTCLLYTSPSPRDRTRSRMPSSA